jgi:hypothetical protein
MTFPPSLDHLTQSISKIRLKGGAVGKICYVLIATILSIAAIAIDVLPTSIPRMVRVLG